MKQIDIIRYIVWYATENALRLTTNRLVKFIYLADLFHARLKQGETITGFPWRFIYYGPYCREVMHSIEQAAQEGVICKDTYDSHFGEEERTYNLFTCSDSDTGESLQGVIPVDLAGQLQKAVRKFGDDTSQLLDYVYFDTEPMENARKGDLLDFSKVRKTAAVKKVELKKLSPETIRNARQNITALSDKMTSNRKRLLKDERETRQYKDDAYYQFLEMLDGEELSTGLKGVAKIEFPE